MTSAVVLAPRAARPASNTRGLLWALPLTVWFLLAAFLPATLTPAYTIADIPVSGYDAALIVTAVLYLAILVCTGFPFMKREGWHRNLPLWVLALFGYAAISVVWSGMDLSNTRAMLYTLLVAASAFALPFAIVASLEAPEILTLLRWAAYGLALAGGLYCLQSFFSLGLRSELGQFYSVGFGIERVKGPLFQSSTGHIILLPAAMFLIQDFLASQKRDWWKLAAAGVLAVTILGLGSRAALGVAVLAVVVVMAVARGVRHRALAGVCLLAGLTAAIGIVFSVASAERLQSFNDPRRMATHLTALSAIENRDARTVLAGSGYGSFWPWYLPDVQLADQIARGADMRNLEYGESLYQPHSVLLLSVVELGLIGAAFLVKLWWTLGTLVFQSWKGSRIGVFGIGVSVTSLSMFADLIIFKNPKISVFWWFYILAALAVSTARPATGLRR